MNTTILIGGRVPKPVKQRDISMPGITHHFLKLIFELKNQLANG